MFDAVIPTTSTYPTSLKSFRCVRNLDCEYLPRMAHTPKQGGLFPIGLATFCCGATFACRIAYDLLLMNVSVVGDASFGS